MKRTLTGAAVIASISATGAVAGGIDREPLNYGILFEQGRTLEISARQATPDVSGTYIPAFGGGTTGNMAQAFSSLSLGFKDDINDRLSYAILLGQPIGADAAYPSGFYTGLEAHWSSVEADALLKYQLQGGVSVYGGLRYVNSRANIVIPSTLMLGSGTYSARTQSDAKVGYLLGAAYEKPEIALRVALTYTSAIDHAFATTENHPAFPTPGNDLNTVTDITLPQSVALDAQTGIAADTLLFGQIRWAQWSKWHVLPPAYTTSLSGGQEITGFDHDYVTYTLGLGRKINDNWSVFGAIGYEAAVGGTSSRLAPTDGMKSLALGAVWTRDKIKMTMGAQYERLGNTVDGAPTSTVFSGNHALALGVKMDYSF